MRGEGEGEGEGGRVGECSCMGCMDCMVLYGAAWCCVPLRVVREF